jgi:hypothetical protein
MLCILSCFDYSNCFLILFILVLNIGTCFDNLYLFWLFYCFFTGTYFLNYSYLLFWILVRVLIVGAYFFDYWYVLWRLVPFLLLLHVVLIAGTYILNCSYLLFWILVPVWLLVLVLLIGTSFNYWYLSFW